MNDSTCDLSWFDASQVPEQQEFSAIPEGQYLALITASERKVSKKGNGDFLELTFQVVDGECKGRKLWARLNLWNNNQTARDIAQRELGAICRSIGIHGSPGKSNNLHDKVMCISVSVELDDRKREANKVVKYEAASGAFSAPQAGTFVPAQTKPQQQPAATAVPWGNR